MSIGPWQTLLIISAVFLAILLPVIALIDILKSEFKGNEKILWVAVVLLSSFFGVVLYVLIGRYQKISK